MSKPVNLHAGYMEEIFTEPKELANRAAAEIRGKDRRGIDLVVGSGVSGSIAAVIIAMKLKKRYAIVRKPYEYSKYCSDDDGRSHSGRVIEGVIASGDRVLFVDDFIGTGRTRNRCEKALAGLRNNFSKPPKIVAHYLYHNSGQRFYCKELIE